MNKNRLEAFGDGVIAINVIFFCEWISIGLYILVAIIWFIPDTRIERLFEDERKNKPS